MTQDDLSNAYDEFDRVHKVTELLLNAQLSPETLVSIDSHKADLNSVIGVLEDIEAYYSDLKKKATNAKKKLERDFDDCKSRYWTLRKSFDRNPTQS